MRRSDRKRALEALCENVRSVLEDPGADIARWLERQKGVEKIPDPEHPEIMEDFVVLVSRKDPSVYVTLDTVEGRWSGVEVSLPYDDLRDRLYDRIYDL